MNRRGNLAKTFWNSRTFDDSGMSLAKAPLPGAAEHPFAPLIEARSAIRLSLDQLEALNMAFDGSLAPDEREPGLDGIVVPLKPLCKALQFCHPLLFEEFEPGVQLFTLPLAQHGGEASDEFIRVRNLLVGLTETRKTSLYATRGAALPYTSSNEPLAGQLEDALSFLHQDGSAVRAWARPT